MPKCLINGQTVSFREGDTILEAARGAGITIPTLCYLKDLNRPAACRICVVEVEGMPRLTPACVTPAKDGMVIQSESEKVISSRKQTLDLMCRNHRMDCEYCPNYTFCELHALLRRYSVDDRLYSQVYHRRNADESGKCIVRDPSKCVLCRRCVSACKKQGMQVIGPMNRAAGTNIGGVEPLAESDCIGCGQCVRNCPTGALFIRNDSDEILQAINRKKHIVFGITRQTAENIGLFFGEQGPVNHMGKLFALLKKAGAKAVFDVTDWEAKALDRAAAQVAARLAEDDGNVVISKCPAATKALPQAILLPAAEEVFHQFIHTDYAQSQGIPAEELFTVFISPCAAAKRAHKCDLVLTTTELHAFLLRVCVSRFTLRQVWERTEEAPNLGTMETQPYWARLQALLEDRYGLHAEIVEADGIPEAKTHLAQKVRLIAVHACPGGCRQGGGQFRTLGYQK